MIVYRCRTLVTMDGETIDNGAFAVEKNRFCQVGPLKDLVRDHASKMVDLGDVIVLPGLINAHCHLDYTLMRGAILPSRSFSHWVGRINALKRNISDEDYLQSFSMGIQELRSNGVTGVLDIVASPQIFSRISAVPIRLWSFLELIDIRPKPWRDDYAFGSWLFLTQNNRALGGFGLSPHSPYTASAEIYGLAQLCATQFSMPITTHLAESQEEYEMFAFGKGALFELLAGLG
ncbi:MAG: amidohydrolase family protein, partial [Verrucomicrobia bacterium]|nr:amidohydrolase family protein [Verrucomicrobiota bacterium]